MNVIEGRVRKFGDNLDTDAIVPGTTMQLPPQEMKKHAFGPVAPDFYKTVRAGDVLVAGKNFGCGSSREQATEVVKELGINFIVCESMARVYFRNCIALGIYPILSAGVGGLCSEGEMIEIDLEKGVVKNTATGKTTSFKPLLGLPKQIFDGDGILSLLKKKITEGN